MFTKATFASGTLFWPATNPPSGLFTIPVMSPVRLAVLAMLTSARPICASTGLVAGGPEARQART